MGSTSAEVSASSSAQPDEELLTAKNFAPWVARRCESDKAPVFDTLTSLSEAREVEYTYEAGRKHFAEANRILFEKLRSECIQPHFFENFGEKLKLIRKIGEGAQGTIYSASINDEDRYAVKAFNKTPELQSLQQLWPLEQLLDAKAKESNLYTHPGNSAVSVGACYSTILHGTILEEDGSSEKNGSFAFVMDRYSMDLRSLIDERMKANGYFAEPFKIPAALHIMYEIGTGIYHLHTRGIVHRDVKASNVLVRGVPKEAREGEFTVSKEGFHQLAYRSNSGDIEYQKFDINDDPSRTVCHIADFECSKDCSGTKFWVAPEGLKHKLKGVEDRKKAEEERKLIWTKEGDVYGFGMVFYEVLTGCHPFEELDYDKLEDCDLVIEGRKKLCFPDFLFHSTKTRLRIKELIEKCLHIDPSQRPSMATILRVLYVIMFDKWKGNEVMYKAVQVVQHPRLFAGDVRRRGPNEEFKVQGIIDGIPTVVKVLEHGYLGIQHQDGKWHTLHQDADSIPSNCHIAPDLYAGQRSSPANLHVGLRSVVPMKEIKSIDDVKYEVIIRRLKEFTNKLSGDEAHNDIMWITTTIATLKGTASMSFDDAGFILLARMVLQWPEEKIFPALDLMGVMLLHPQYAAHFAVEYDEGNDLLMEALRRASSETALWNNVQASSRVAVNACQHPSLRHWCEKNRSEILELFPKCHHLIKPYKNTRLYYITLLLNYSVLSTLERKDVEWQMKILHAAKEMAELKEPDTEVRFRALVTIGTLIHSGSVNFEAFEDAKLLAISAGTSPVPKVAAVGSEILNLLL
ncbi:hypothetical protein KC19_7G016000 [Ceratodon purpureus]|uniref:Uncharacterized protein n=1 Tax=Ceratodon purpureus TaxID=3225 RepID=A0A8T0H614_CERPU|nr:hypothetical protein KC19_7G016000 [Ceratodon purpureus]